MQSSLTSVTAWINARLPKNERPMTEAEAVGALIEYLRCREEMIQLNSLPSRYIPMDRPQA